MTDLVVVQRSPTILVANGPAVPVPHATSHGPAGTDPLSALYASLAHASQHAPGGTDELRPLLPYSSQIDATVGLVLAPAAAATSLLNYLGGSDLVHPDVVVCSRPWNGYRYWMAVTPYENTDTATENPSVYCSTDGLTWITPPGGSNPIEPAPGGTTYLSDNDLIIAGGTGYLFFRWTDGTTDRWYLRTSTDGATWTAKVMIHEVARATETPLSPGFTFDGQTWRVWYVDATPSPNRIRFRTASSPAGPWSAAQDCAFGAWPVTGREAWHLDAFRVNDQTILLINDTTTDAAGSGGNLYLSSTVDGTTLSAPTQVMISPGSFAGKLYRSCLTVTEDANGRRIRVWYSAIPLSGTTGWRMSYTEAPLAADRQDGAAILNGYGVAVLLAERPVAPYVAGDGFDRADGAALGTAPSGQAWTASAGTPGILSRKAYASVGGNTRAYLEGGIADAQVEVELSVVDGASNGWVIGRLQDASNYWRFGHPNGSVWNLQKVVAGGVTAVGVVPSITAPANGARVGMRMVGSRVQGLVNGRVVIEVTDATFNTQTKFGIQCATTVERFDNFTVRAAS